MREALARINNDAFLAEPRRSSKPVDIRPGFFQKSKQAAFFAAKHANLFLGLLFVVLLSAVLANALLWQKAPHPAPLFAHSIPIEAKTEATKSEGKSSEGKSGEGKSGESKSGEARSEAPIPASRPATAPEPTTSIEHATVNQPPHGRDPMAEVANLAAQKPAAAPKDPIAQLIKSSPPVESSKTVLSAQRALMKLGYVVKPDGAMTPATRQALEQFERDRGLPTHGHLSPKIMHELSAQSGIQVQ